jgi:hypothetical protein
VVVSHSNNFIFLRVPKNASSSLAEFFVRNCCDSNDQYTAVNDCGINNNNIPPAVLSKYRHQSRFIHLTLDELVSNEIITRDKAKSMTKIMVLRNPFDRQLSLYFFLCKQQRKQPSANHFREVFSNGVHESDTNNAFCQIDYIKVADQIQPNIEIWRYENLNQELELFSKSHSIKHSIKQHKSGKRPQKPMNELVEEYYDQKTKDAVLRYYANDFEALDILL